MKKTLLAFTLASIFMSAAVQAVDHPATVDINGTLTSDSTECNVITSSNTVNLNGHIERLPNQGDNATNNASGILLAINDSRCNGKVVLQFHGQADDADGTALANTDASEAAAKGVGIGIFDKNLAPLEVNNSQMTPSTTGSSIYLQMVKLSNQTPVEGTVHGSLTIDIVRL